MIKFKMKWIALCFLSFPVMSLATGSKKCQETFKNPDQKNIKQKDTDQKDADKKNANQKSTDKKNEEQKDEEQKDEESKSEESKKAVELTAAEETKIDKNILYMLKQTLVLPRLRDLAKYIKIPRSKLEKTIDYKELTQKIWNEINDTDPLYLKNLKKNLAKAFIRSIKDSNNVKWNNKTPDIQRLYEVYISYYQNHGISYPKGIKTKDHLNYMLGAEVPVKKLHGALPVLFPNGLKEVEEFARQMSPNAFENYIDSGRFSREEDQKTAEMILKAKGAIVTTATAGIPTNQDFFENLKVYAKDRGFPIVILAVNAQTDGLDPYLLQNPDQVRVVTHTIEFGEFLRIWAIPVMPKNANPFASLNTHSQGKRGQIQIVGSPQQLHSNVATADNKNKTHGLWSPGSVSEGLYPAKNPASYRVSELAKNRHDLGFLVVEMTDKSSGSHQKGTPGAFHIRPIKYFDHRDEDGSSGFMDLNNFYTNNQKKKQNVDVMVVGDLHDQNANQILLTVFEDIIRQNGVKTFVLHDALDGASHNHHESKKLAMNLEKYKKGELQIKKEVEGLIQTINGYLDKFPDLRMVINDSNHNYWIDNLLDDPYAVADLENREFLLELLYATTHLKVSVFEFLFNHHRQTLHKGLEPRIRDEKLKNNIYISDPSRVKIMAKGEPFIVGPDHNPVHLHFHGHKGANGAKGSMPSHARAAEQIVIGDSHQPGILGGAYNVGVSTDKEVPYTKGGYSGWQNALVLVNELAGTVQLITIEPITHKSWRQDSKNGFLPDSTHPKIKVHPTDNELLPDDADMIDPYANVKFLRGR